MMQRTIISAGEIVSGKSHVRFEDSDRSGDDMDFVAVKPGTAKIRCYVYGKNKDRYGDTIKVSVTEAKKRLLSPEVRSFCQV